MECLRCDTELVIYDEVDFEDIGELDLTNGILVSLYCPGCDAYVEAYLPYVEQFKEPEFKEYDENSQSSSDGE